MQILFNGLATGSVIALLAVSFAVVYRPTRIFYLALAGIYTVVPFVALAVLETGAPHWLGAVAGLAAGALLSLGCEVLNHHGLERKGASDGLHLISSLGLYIVLVQSVSLVWGNEAKTLGKGLDLVFSLGDIRATRTQLLALVIPLTVLSVYWFTLRRSHVGLQLRAMGENAAELALKGYSIRNLRLLCFGIAGLFCGASSLLTAMDVGFDPHGGLPALLLAVTAVIVGGRDSFLGPFIGGILLGVLRAEVAWIGAAKWQDAATFSVLVVFLLFWPRGLIARQT